MKITLRIMKTELQVLFYSPIAWLVLIVFTFLTGMEVYNIFSEATRSQSLGYSTFNASLAMLAGYSGVLTKMLSNLYLYIPLLTMGLMSRELNSGSIKLLYSSPITNMQVVMGKYLSIIVYGLILMAVLIVPVIFAACTVNNFDAPAILCALLGVFLTISTYAAIGLFMSTITKYQVVAVIGTIAMLSVLKFIDMLGANIDILRNVTHWLSMSGRSSVFLYGMISTKDVIYFLLAIAMFLSFTIIRLQGERSRRSKLEALTKYGAVFAVAILVGYISNLPACIYYYDGTDTKRNTLSKNSQEVINKLEGGLTMTTYVNILGSNSHKGMPREYNYEKYQFEKYLRFKPELKMEYVYYYKKPEGSELTDRYPGKTEEELVDILCDLNEYDRDMFIPLAELQKTDDMDLEFEQYRYVRRLERESGEQAILRIYNDMRVDPSEKEISVAFKTMVQESPLVGFVSGHGERSITDVSDRGYALFGNDITFRHCLLNQGFKTKTVSLSEEVSESVDILVISDVKSHYSETEISNFQKFIARGGNLLILGEPRRQEFMNPLVASLGVKFAEGMLVQPTKEYGAEVVVANVANGALDVSKGFEKLIKDDIKIVTPSACVLEYTSDKGFDVSEVLVANPGGVWNDFDNVDLLSDTPTLDSDESEQAYPIMLYLTRDVNDKEQRIVVIGDSDCVSVAELNKHRTGIDASNFSLITECFTSMSYEEYPLDVSRVRPSDDRVKLTQVADKWIMIFFMYLLPGVLLIYSIYLLVSRKRK